MNSSTQPTAKSANSYRKIRVFVASPGDVAREKDALGKVITSLNRTLGDRFGIVLELKEWRQVAPDMGRPEDVILADLRVESWDIFVGILWLRFGMAPGAVDPTTGRPFDSGTEEEFSLAYRAWQKFRRPRILFYRSLRLPPRLLDIDGVQFDRVGRFFKQFDAINGQHPGLFSEYLEVEDFKDLVREHLEKHLLDDHIPASAEPPTTTKAPVTRGFTTKGEASFDLTTLIQPPPAPGRPILQTSGMRKLPAFLNPFIIGRPITDLADFFGREMEVSSRLASASGVFLPRDTFQIPHRKLPFPSPNSYRPQRN